MKYTNKYDDIIDLPHHVSKSRPRMSIHDRAAQFSPFAALTGHGAAIKETERLTEHRIELDENQKSMINEKLQMIFEQVEKHPEVSITYFVPDQHKTGGKYITIEGRVMKVDGYHRNLIFEDQTLIPMTEILEIEEKIGDRKE